jgi:hypothetical protein
MRLSFRKMKRDPVILAIVLINILLAISAKAAPMPDPLIPREVVFGDRDKLNVRLSPDGQTISYLAPVDDKLGVWICSVADPGKPRLLFKETDVPIFNPQWSYTSRDLIYQQPVGKDVHVFVFNLAADSRAI